jgi:hypothetical protein
MTRRDSDDVARGDDEEVEPPWVAHPGYPPGDGFWRQSGETWFTLVWEPYWQALTLEKRKQYLDRWKVPADWEKYYFDDDFQRWLSSADDES